VIERIINWIIGEVACTALLLWLHGAAGAGKSAIAHSLVERCDRGRWLLATFFFWRTASERSKVDCFVATIAYQAARAIPALHPFIDDAVDSDPMIFHHSIEAQLNKLILDPLQQLHSTGFDFRDYPFVIIIDGLDECQGDLVQSGLVKSLAAAFFFSPLRIRILIASRPEIYLQATFNSSSINPYLSRLALSEEYSPDKDIYQFYEDSFETMRHEHPLATYIPPSWPGPENLSDLTRKSSGHFIFASTVVRYICGDFCELPTRRLNIIRQVQPPRGDEDLPYAELNSLYNYVLSKVRDIKRVMQVLGFLVILNPDMIDGRPTISSAHMIDSFLFWNPGETQACLSQLASVMECDADGDIHILHASLRDFLCDPFRSRQFYLCRESVLSGIALLGLRHMSHEMIDISQEGTTLPTAEKIPFNHSIMMYRSKMLLVASPTPL